MKMLKYFLECYFHFNEGFDNLDNLIQNFKQEVDSEQLKFIRELHAVIEMKNYSLASKVIKKYGHRTFDEEKTKKFINFLYDRSIDRPTNVKPQDFKRNLKGVFCPNCCPNSKTQKSSLSLIEKATIIENGLEIYICKPCKLIWLSEDIKADNVHDYKKFMKARGLKGTWKELKDIDYL